MGDSSGPAITARFRRVALTSIGVLLLLGIVGLDSISVLFGASVVSVVDELQSGQLSRRDTDEMTRGYYEHLTDANPLNSRLWELYAGTESREDRLPLRETDLITRTGDLLWMVLKPDLRSTYRGRPFHTNRWGMRDRDYERTPPPGVHRIALLGQSYVMGGGVSNSEVFETLMEDRLNSGADSVRVEILNFGSGNYLPARQLVQLEQTVLAFQPDVVISVGHQGDLRRMPSSIADAIYGGAEIPFPFVRQLLDSLSIGSDTPHDEIMRRLSPYGERIYRDIQSAFVALCREAGAIPVWVLIPTPDVGARDEGIDSMVNVSREAGFRTIDLLDVYGEDPQSYWVASWDSHPDVDGHRRIADRLLTVLRQEPDLLGSSAR